MTLVLTLAAAPAPADAPAPIRVLAQVPPKAYYVGQAIELRIGAEAEGERPEVIPPAIPNTEVSLIGTTLSPISAAGIGPLTTERNLFVTRFRLIPHRAGLLRIPPVRVRLGARTGASPPLSIEVRSLPVSGRPAEFLGGVGPFAVAAEASPSTLRVGQDLTFTIRVTGPAARGMSSAPDLARFSQTALGLQVVPLTTLAVDSPPSRSFRYRIRPTRTGASSLPPVAIAAFDPQAARYVTKVTPSIPIRVVDVPKFDPATLDYPSPASQATTPRLATPAGRALAVLIPAIAALLLSAIAARTILDRRKKDPRRLLLRRARALDPRQGAVRTARLITDTLAEYLERTSGRPRGVLTPDEARSAIAQATRDADLGARGARLVADCDRACYSDREPRTSELIAAARRLWKEMGRK